MEPQWEPTIPRHVQLTEPDPGHKLLGTGSYRAMTPVFLCPAAPLMASDRPSHSGSPVVRGVFPADSAHPPKPPVGAVAMEVIDAAGRTIGYAWVAPDHAGSDVLEGLWEWLDRHVPLTEPTDDPLPASLERRLKLL